jgi:hypothetical protein
MSSVLHNRAKAAALSRSRAADDPELLAARRQLAFDMLEKHVEKVVALAPPLTAEQRERIATLLSCGGGGGDAA